MNQRLYLYRIALLATALLLPMTALPLAVAAEPLTSADFQQIGDQGFGQRGNSYAWSMAFFRGKIYIGTNHNFLCLVRSIRGISSDTADPEVPADCDPVLVKNDFRGRIYSYDPATRQLELVYISPTIKALTSDGSTVDVAVDLGYRTMRVFREPDGAEALYVGTFVSTEVPGAPPRILRSVDGRHFEPLPGPISSDDRYVSYRGLTVFKDKLYVIAIGRVDVEGALLEFTDAPRGEFRVVNPPHFGDPVNISAFDLAVFKGSLYVGTATATEGFQLLKTQAAGRPPYTFTTVLTKGAYRGGRNQNIVSMQPFGDWLYIGTGINFVAMEFIPGTEYAAAELLRVKADDSWEIVCGQSRDTPEGLREPISGMSDGFNNPFTGYIWRMTVHDGLLYLGTFDMSLFGRYTTTDQIVSNIDFNKFPLLESFIGWFPIPPDDIADVVAAVEGGFDLWATPDGESWSQLSRNGLSDEYAYGVRSFLSTPYGLFLGTANPYFGFRVYQAQPADSDLDGDSFPDTVDNCPTIWNFDQRDLDGDGIGDACDPDMDGDCLPDATDPDPQTASAPGTDTDGNGTPDACDSDDDGDGIPDLQDNCPLVANPDQIDLDGDGQGDACEIAGGSAIDATTDGTDSDPTVDPPASATCGAGVALALGAILLSFVIVRRT